MNHYENQQKIISVLSSQKASMCSPRTTHKLYSMKPMDFKVSPSSSTTFLDRIPTLTTSRVLQHMGSDSKKLAASFWRTAGQYFDIGSMGKDVGGGKRKEKRGYLMMETEENDKAFNYPITAEEKLSISEELQVRIFYIITNIFRGFIK